MSKKVFNVFSILCFALVLCFIGCTELINPKTVTDINLNIDLSKIIKSTRNTGETQSSVSLGENPTIKVAIYDAKKYNATTNSTDNLDLITEAQAKIVNNEAKVKLNNIPVGIDAIVFAELSFSNGNSTEVMYAGNSEVFRVKPTDNKISLVLIKVEVDIEVDIEVKPDDSKPEEIINAKEPEIIIQPISCVKTTTESTTGGTTKTTLTCTAKSTDGGNLSFMWYKSEDSTYFEEFYSIVGPSLNDDGSYTSSTSEIEAQIGQRLYFYCVVTNTNENATGNKVASVRSNTVQVACIEGILSSISATYKSDSYELLGKNFNYNNVTVEETYKSGSDDNATTTITVIADESRYTISPTTDSKDAIGYVPYTVTYKDTTLPSNLTASLIVPVKYELDANNLVLETYFNSSSVSVSDTENKINIPQYGTVKYSYQISDNDKISFIDKNGDNTEIKDINNTGYYTATIVDEKNQDIPNGSICTSDGSYKYTVTLKSANEWFVCNSNTSKDFFVEVCPWKIVLTPLESTSTVDTNNISLGTYTLSISNDAYTSTSQNLPPATFSCLVNDKNIITNNEFTIDEVFTTGTITASIGNIEVASLEISRIDTSTYEAFILRQRDTDGKEVTDVTGANIETSSTAATKVTVTNPDSSESVWTYFVKPENNTRFVDDGNYKVSVDLKTKSGGTTVVGIAAARADYFFTVNSDWTTCEFETGYLIGNENHQFTIGLGLSSEIEIRNLKIEKLETTGTSEPSLVFDISKDAINSYLKQENRPEKIVDVTKEATNGSYNITINTPMCHSTGTDDSYIQDVKLHLRSYATNNTGANNVSFNITNTGRNDFETSVMADTANDKSISWNNNATKFSENNGGNFSVDFPNYKANDELIVDLITSSTSTSQNNSTSFILSNFKVGKAEEPPFSDKIFVYKTNANDGKGDVFAKLEDSSTISINSYSQINFDVLMFNYDAWLDESYSLTYNAFDEATRFIFADTTSTIGNLTYNVSQDNDGNPIYTLQNNTDIPVTVKISLNENYEVVIEESTSTSGGGISLNEISSWEVLVTKIDSLSDYITTTEFVITENLTATSIITVNKPIKIIAESPVTITRGNTTGNTSFTDVFFKVETSGSLELEGKENSTITLDGGNANANETSIEAEAPLITSSGNLTLTNCTLQNNTLNNTFQGFGNGGAVYVSGGTFTMKNSSIIDCSANVNGGAVYITDKGTFNMNGGAISWCKATNSGGGVWMNSGSSFTMSGDSRIDSCNSKSEGGGVYVTGEDNTCTFKMLDSATITGCSAVNGGAVYVSGGTFTMNNLGTISYCNAKDGGAVYITDGGTFTMNDDASISNCNATNSGGGCGGGVWMNSGSSFTMSGGKIERCSSDFNGGGVYVTDSSNTCTFKMLDNATITECSAVNGGGIYLYGKLTMNGGTISYNSATSGAGVYVKYENNVLSSLSMSGNAFVDSSNDVYLANGATVTVAGKLTYDGIVVATITPSEYNEGTQVLTAENGETLADYVGKFALSDETYSIGNDGNIVASNQSSAISLTQDYLKGKVKTNTSGDSYYELEAGEYFVSENLKLEYPIQINAASGGEVKLYADGDYTISCAEDFDNSANSAMIVLPMNTGTLTLGGGEGTLTIDGSGISSLMYLILSQSTLILQDKCTITNGNVTYTAIYVSAGTFTMTGGTITNIHSTKAASEGYGAGIHVLGPSTVVTSTVVTVSGGSVCNNYNKGTNQGASIYSTNNSITVLGETIPKETLYTYNIVNGQQQDVSASLIEGAYYVSANGDDSNDGLTAEKPLLTLSSAIEKANNNSDSKTVYVIGTLNATSESSSDSETVFFIAASVGTADSPINIIGYPDSDATLSALDDTGAANKRVFETDLESYIKMKDLILTGGNASKSGAAIYYYNGELTLEDCKINGNKTAYSADFDSGIYYDGIYMYGTSNKLNMKNTECTDGIYLYNCTANFDDDCLLGYDDSTEIPIIHINKSSLNLGDVYFSNSIYSDAESPICLTTSLTKHSNDEPIYIKLPNNVEGNQIISATSVVTLSEEVKKFTLSDTNYTISYEGKVVQNSGGGIANYTDTNGILISNYQYQKTSLVTVISEKTTINCSEEGEGVFGLYWGGSVTLSPFAMGQYEVTQELYQEIMPDNPSTFTSVNITSGETQNLRPVDSVNWYEAVAFCNELTKQTMGNEYCVYYTDESHSTVYTTNDASDKKLPYFDQSKKGYRLPTEAEWEFAARGGDTKQLDWNYAYPGVDINDDDSSDNLITVAWFKYLENYEFNTCTHEVGLKLHNRLNLFDMAGNVQEWCWDLPIDDEDISYYNQNVTNPVGSNISSEERIVRGGYWEDYESSCKCTSRYQADAVPTTNQYLPNTLGFRICRSL